MSKLRHEDVNPIVQEARKKGNRPDFSGLDFNKLSLAWMDLSGADLRGANLLGTNFFEANLIQTDLREADLFGADLVRVDLREADLSGADLRKADLSEANLGGANLGGANLSGANLDRANLFRADLSKSNFREANLILADLFEADLILADLSGANLFEADLAAADLSGANLAGANLSGANLSGADFSGVYIGWTVFGDVDFRELKGLDTVTHWGPSAIGIDTLAKSKGNIPIEFLRGCGLNDWEIENTKLYNPTLTENQIIDITHKISSLLTGDAINYHSCFISYSHKDENFVQRFYADLQSKGVRCWYAPEDLKIGDKIRHTIDQSIRIHDKLLLILSERSVASDWVEHEVERALDLERERKEPVLFPIRLDNAVIDSNAGWAGNIKRLRHIGDFTQWEEDDAYQKSFDRVLRDLKVGNNQ